MRLQVKPFSLPRDLSISLLPITFVIAVLILEDVNHQVELPAASLPGFQPKAEQNFVWSVEQRRWLLSRQQKEDSSPESPIVRPVCLWPEDNCAGKDDRIIDQLQLRIPDQQQTIVRIFPAHAMSSRVRSFAHQLEDEDEDFEPQDNCPPPVGVSHNCKLTYNLERADVVIYPNADVIHRAKQRARREQIWLAYLLESPPNTFPERYQRLHRSGRHQFNWTASYRSDSDLVAPYAKFVPYLDSPPYPKTRSEPVLRQSLEEEHQIQNPAHRQLIRGKTKQVAWFASNCHTENRRLQVVKGLARHIQVDIYGKCGQLNCDKWNQSGCLEMLNRDYKFYLAFENSNSPEYITEKLYRNALGDNNPNYLLLPIVLGPSRGDYERLAPPNSFIHVDDFASDEDSEDSSLQRLANYLRLLDSNDALYYSYFSWKTMGRFVDTHFMCRVCLLAHQAHHQGKSKIYHDLKSWFTGKNRLDSER